MWTRTAPAVSFQDILKTSQKVATLVRPPNYGAGPDRSSCGWFWLFAQRDIGGAQCWHDEKADPSGKLISPGAHGQTAIQDSNGNILAAPWGATNTDAFGNITSFTALIQDTVNTKITMTGGGYRTDYSGRQPLVITYLDDNGNLQNITIGYRTYNYSTGTAGLVDTIGYPSGAAYHFTYALDSSGGVTGTNAALASMTLSSGGVISYTYPGESAFVASEGLSRTGYHH